MDYNSIRAAVGVITFVCCTSPALADGPVSVAAGPAFFVDRSAQNVLSGAVGTDIAIGYDIGRSNSAKVRFRADLDDAFIASPDARLGYVGGGISARLSSPLYAGAGLTLDQISLRQRVITLYPGSLGGGVISFPVATTSSTSLGPNFFIGQKIFSSREVGLSFEASYKITRTVQFVNLSTVRVGLRANF